MRASIGHGRSVLLRTKDYAKGSNQSIGGWISDSERNGYGYTQMNLR